LPQDVRVLTAEEAPEGFNARFSARRKTYRYRVLAGPVASPFERLYAWHVRQALDVAAMRAALSELIGRHDFASFQAVGTDVMTTTRTVLSADLGIGIPPADPSTARILVFELTADGFLRHMMRNIVGTVVEVGQGKRDPTTIPGLLSARNRALAGPTAPAHGLFLLSVHYDEIAPRGSPRLK
jgi:tRNA pseudouridine38-40 synthase